MPIIKCKMCGGDLRLEEGSTVCECEYCGTRQTVPSADNEKKLTLFSRARRLLRSCEFDKAAGVFETIVADFPDEAEAYWGLVLCKYGIVYVDDPATGKKIPTCHRSSFDSVLDDPNFEQACENTDAVARRVYRDEARQIEDLRKRIIEVSGKEEPYDVFISYKETDEHSDRTLDSVIAQDIYTELTEKGYRVFFSRISLEDKLGTEYEPYIFAALNSAKVMLVVGTDYENYDAVWVKNEWSRFLKLIASGQKKTLIPVFKNMDAYDMPKEFAKLAAQDMGKVGAMQDLVRGVEKLIGKKGGGSKQTVKETVVIQQGGGPNVAALLKRGQQALEDKAWDKAEEFYDQVLSMDAENAEAFFGLFLAEENCTDESAYIDKVCRIPANTETLSIKPATERIEVAIRDNVMELYFSESEIRKLFKFNLNYSSTVKSQKSIVQQIKMSFQDNRELNRAFRYASEEMTARLERFKAKLFSRLDDMVKDAEKQEETAALEKKAAYEAFLAEAETTAREKRREVEEQKEADYQALCSKIEQASKIREYRSAIERLSGRFLNYKDSGEKAEYCNRRIAEITEAYEKEERRKREEKEKAEKAAVEEVARSAKAAATRKKITVSILVSLVITAIVAILVYTKIIVPGNAYKNAEALFETGQYEEAITAFEALGDYKDSATRITEAEISIKERDNARDYAAAEAMLASGDIARAALSFGALGDYQDAQARCMKLWDQVAQRNTISAGDCHTVGLRTDGTVVATEYKYIRDTDQYQGQCDVSSWTDIVAIAAGAYHTVGLRADGTVVAVGKNYGGQCDVSSWTDIVAIAAGANHTVGLRADGTVVAVGDNYDGQCDVDSWTSIIAIAAGSIHTVGLRVDGTVVAVGDNDSGRCDIDNWADIVAIAAQGYHTVGLRSDGTVVATGYNGDGECNVSSWTDIVAVATEYGRTMALRADGTVISTRERGMFDVGEYNFDSWTDIVAIAGGHFHIVGLRADGTVIAIQWGWYDNGQCDVSDWTNIKLPRG